MFVCNAELTFGTQSHCYLLKATTLIVKQVEYFFKGKTFLSKNVSFFTEKIQCHQNVSVFNDILNEIFSNTVKIFKIFHLTGWGEKSHSLPFFFSSLPSSRRKNSLFFKGRKKPDLSNAFFI